jgi:hypothetical protein
LEITWIIAGGNCAGLSATTKFWLHHNKSRLASSKLCHQSTGFTSAFTATNSATNGVIQNKKQKNADKKMASSSGSKLGVATGFRLHNWTTMVHIDL